VSWVPKAGPEVCWSSASKLVCKDSLGGPVGDQPELGSRPLEPQWGWEQQKFVVLWAYLYLPSSEVFDWSDMMRVYRSGSDQDPAFPAADRVEWRDPLSGIRYTAKRYGNETILGKSYDKGIAAKMIQWANHLTEQAYELNASQPFDPVTGAANVVLDPVTKTPKVKRDPSIAVPPSATTISCDDNTACQRLRYYRGLLDYTRDTAARLGHAVPQVQEGF
jgi:hypothetical protein